MPYLGLIGGVYRYCKFYPFILGSSGLFISSIYAGAVGPNGTPDYLDAYIYIDGSVRAVQYQTTTAAAGGFSLSAATSDLLMPGSHSARFCVNFQGGLSSVSTTFSYSLIN